MTRYCIGLKTFAGDGSNAGSVFSDESQRKCFGTQQKPDFFGSKVDVRDKNGSPSCITGSIIVTATVHNDTGRIAGPLDVEISADGTGREMVITGGVAANSDKVVEFTALDLSPGAHTIRVTADPEGTVQERDESDNSSVVMIDCPVGAEKPALKPVDLQISKFEVTNSAGAAGCVAGDTNSIGTSVKNDGDTEVGAVITVELKIDGKPGNTVTVGGVGANSDKLSFFLPIDLPKGTHTLLATVDSLNQISEGDEQNNTATIQVDCT